MYYYNFFVIIIYNKTYDIIITKVVTYIVNFCFSLLADTYPHTVRYKAAWIILRINKHIWNMLQLVAVFGLILMN